MDLNKSFKILKIVPDRRRALPRSKLKLKIRNEIEIGKPNSNRYHFYFNFKRQTFEISPSNKNSFKF